MFVALSSMMLVVIGWQFSLVAPWSELVLLVAVRWTSPDLDVDVLVVSGHRLIVRCEHEQEREQYGASREG